MCGIAGFMGKRPIGPATRALMMQALLRRGPDSQAEVAWNSAGTIISHGDPATAALLHARLAIIDPRPLANQPMRNDRGDVWLCYNGEVYGWADDAAKLTEAGFHFRSRSDTEFILHGYEYWGLAELLPRLRGMFAFALWDQRIQRLFLVRDRYGEKPLVYAHQAGDLAFGSTVRSVLPWLPKQHRAWNPHAIDAYLAHRYIPAPMTIFQDIHRLENGHYLEFNALTGQLNKTCYWQPPLLSNTHQVGTTPNDAGHHHAIEHALAELSTATSLRTIADRPVGLFLSGGIDSACIASILQTQGKTDLRAFTAAFPGSSYDEAPQAQAIAHKLGMPWQAIPFASVGAPAQVNDYRENLQRTTSINAIFDDLIADLDDPFADPSCLPTWLLAKQVSPAVKVVLTGDGGDECLLGYKRYRQHLRTSWRKTPSLLISDADRETWLAGLIRQLPWLGQDMANKGWRKSLAELSLPWHSAYSLRFSGFTPCQRQFLSDAPLPPHHLAGWWRQPDSDLQALPTAHALQAQDFANTLPEYILRKTDLCTMAHGLEARSPMLDHHWMAALAKVPTKQRFKLPSKSLLASQMAQLEALQLFTQKKRGFNPPLVTWLGKADLGNRLDDLAQNLENRTNGQLRADRVQAMLDHFLGLNASEQNSWAERILQLLILDTSLAQLERLKAI